QGAISLSLDPRGNLVVHTDGGDLVEQAPVLYQMVNGVRQTVSGRYVLENPIRNPQSAIRNSTTVAFQVGPYDATKTLVIDPVYAIVYSTYFGSSRENAYHIAVDSSGNAYLTGNTDSNNLAT